MQHAGKMDLGGGEGSDRRGGETTMEMAESQGVHIALFSITEKTYGEGEGTGPECAHRSLQIGAHTLLTDMSPIFGAPGTSSASAGKLEMPC